MVYRVALYYAPPRGSAIERFAMTWLGRDHETGAPLEQPAVPGIAPERFKEITTSPRRYGFHATIKAPFRLAPDQALEELSEALGAFCSDRQAFEARLQIASVGGYIAFVLAEASPAMAALEDETVRRFEPFRAPLQQEEIDRRRPGSLTERQARQFFEFGYPFIFEDFRFHMTLSHRLEGQEHDTVLAGARAQAAPVLDEPHRFDGLAVYEQADPDADFLVTRRFFFKG